MSCVEKIVLSNLFGTAAADAPGDGVSFVLRAMPKSHRPLISRTQTEETKRASIYTHAPAVKNREIGVNCSLCTVRRM